MTATCCRNFNPHRHDCARFRNPERGRIAFQACLQYIGGHLETRGPVTFSAPDSNESGWTNIGANLWAVHGALQMTNDQLGWTATLEDHGENWRFEELKIGRTTVIEAGSPVKGIPEPAPGVLK